MSRIGFHYPHGIDPMFLRPDGYQRGSFDMAMNSIVECSRNFGTVVDVGAHIGTWSVRFAKVFERVVCIEGNPDVLPFLKKNVPTARIIPHYVNGAPESTLDAMLADEERVDMIKIDTDSPLCPILAGMHGTLEKHDPLLCIEMVHMDVPDEPGFLELQRLGYSPIAMFNKDFVFIRGAREYA